MSDPLERRATPSDILANGVAMHERIEWRLKVDRVLKQHTLNSDRWLSVVESHELIVEGRRCALELRGMYSEYRCLYGWFLREESEEHPCYLVTDFKHIANEVLPKVGYRLDDRGAYFAQEHASRYKALAKSAGKRADKSRVIVANSCCWASTPADSECTLRECMYTQAGDPVPRYGWSLQHAKQRLLLTEQELLEALKEAGLRYQVKASELVPLPTHQEEHDRAMRDMVRLPDWFPLVEPYLLGNPQIEGRKGFQRFAYTREEQIQVGGWSIGLRKQRTPQGLRYALDLPVEDGTGNDRSDCWVEVDPTKVEDLRANVGDHIPWYERLFMFAGVTRRDALLTDASKTAAIVPLGKVFVEDAWYDMGVSVQRVDGMHTIWTLSRDGQTIAISDHKLECILEYGEPCTASTRYSNCVLPDSFDATQFYKDAEILPKITNSISGESAPFSYGRRGSVTIEHVVIEEEATKSLRWSWKISNSIGSRKSFVRLEEEAGVELLRKHGIQIDPCKVEFKVEGIDVAMATVMKTREDRWKIYQSEVAATQASKTTLQASPVVSYEPPCVRTESHRPMPNILEAVKKSGPLALSYSAANLAKAPLLRGLRSKIGEGPIQNMAYAALDTRWGTAGVCLGLGTIIPFAKPMLPPDVAAKADVAAQTFYERGAQMIMEELGDILLEPVITAIQGLGLVAETAAVTPPATIAAPAAERTGVRVDTRATSSAAEPVEVEARETRAKNNRRSNERRTHRG